MRSFGWGRFGGGRPCGGTLSVAGIPGETGAQMVGVAGVGELDGGGAAANRRITSG